MPSVCRRLRHRLQHLDDGARGPRRARAVAQPPRGRRRLALRPRPLRALRAARPTGSASRCSARRAGSASVAWDDATRTIAQRLRHADALARRRLGRDRRRRQPDQRGGLRLGPHRPRGAGAVTASGPVAAEGAWELLDPYAARIDDLDRADVIVVVGDADVADRAGTLELRIRKARRRGAHLMIVGPGGSALERDAGSLRRARPARDRAGARRPRRAIPARWQGAEHPVLIVTDRVDTAAIAAAAHALGLHERGGVLPLPRRRRTSAAPACAASPAAATSVLAAIEAGHRAGAGAARRRPDRRVAGGRPLADGAGPGRATSWRWRRS